MQSPSAVKAVPGFAQRNTLVESNRRLVRMIAYQILAGLPGHIDVEDLISAGTVGLIEAVDRFDAKKGVQFNTYASIRIRGAIMDELRRQDWMTRSMRDKSNHIERAYAEVERRTGRPAEADDVARLLNLTMDELHGLMSEVCAVSVLNLEDMGVNVAGDAMDILEALKDEGAKDPLAEAKLSELKRRVCDAIESLPAKERTAISLYYYDELTLKEIGSVLGITESRVCQIHAQIMTRLKGRLKRFYMAA